MTLTEQYTLASNEIFISDTVVGHGVVFLDHTRNGWLFLETDRDKLKEIKKLRKIN